MEAEFGPTALEINLHLDLGVHGPRYLERYANALAAQVSDLAEDWATISAEVAGSEEVHAARPEVRYRLLTSDGWSEWKEVEQTET